MSDISEKREYFKNEIKNIPNSAYNHEQKQLACEILDFATEQNIDAIYTFITQRIKLGFTFDIAPEVNHNAVSLIQHSDKLSFGNITGQKHKLIIGENYNALKNLLVVYSGAVDVIYIDPPYNTESAKGDGNDHKDNVSASKFIYRDKFTRNGWLNMMRERLIMARKLLSDTGVIFISIDDSEQAYLKVLMDEIFGEDNFICNLIWQKNFAPKNDNKYISISTEYILFYAKKKELFKRGLLPRTDKHNEIYGNPDNDPRGVWGSGSMLATTFSPNGVFAINSPSGKTHMPPKGRCWRYSETKIKELYEDNRIWFGSNGDGVPRIKRFLSELPDGIVPQNLLLYQDVGSNQDGALELKKIFGAHIFDFPKGPKLIKHLLKIANKPNGIILDFFAGSGTTGQAVMELNADDGGNRTCILVTNNENNIATNVTRERLYRVVMGIGTGGEKFSWTWTAEQPYLTNNYWDVFELQDTELKIDDFDKAKKLLKSAEYEFQILNPNYKHNDFDIYNQLASLNPIKKD